MAKQSAGLLMYRKHGGRWEVFLVHPGGPYWQNKELGAWSIPKGEFLEHEDPLAVAKREFHEETGIEPAGDFVPLESVQQRGGKTVHAWLVQGDCDARCVKSNKFSIEWPPNSGRFAEFPEVDRADWFCIDEAREKMLSSQQGFLDQLQHRLASHD
jgi:predicted NUDIX family NTP pyrophosphohydrolase